MLWGSPQKARIGNERSKRGFLERKVSKSKKNYWIRKKEYGSKYNHLKEYWISSGTQQPEKTNWTRTYLQCLEGQTRLNCID